MSPIDADAMHKFVEEKVAEGKDGRANGVPYEWAYALTAVDMQPTLDLAPVVHGRWIPGEEKCPVCKKDKFDGLDADIWADWQPAYCPNCGAKMDGGKKDG